VNVKIGHVVSSIEFSDAEKDRLGAALLDQGSRPLAILRTQARQIRDQDFWRRAQKRFNVTGFRQGHPVARDTVIRRALDDLKAHQGSRNHNIWPLYRQCVVDYVVSDLKDLDRLLSTEDFVESEGSLTDQVLRCIKKVMPLHGATLEQVRELYELWGFDRSEHIEDILVSAELDIDVINRMIAREGRKLLQELVGRLDETRRQLRADIRQEAADIGDEIERLEAELATAVANSNSTLSNAFDQIRDLKGALAHVSVSTPQPSPKQPGPKTTTVDEQVIQGLRARIESIAGVVRSHEKALVDGGLTGVKSERRDAQKARASTGTWEQILQRCRKACVDNGYTGLSLAAVWSLVELLRRSRSIITVRDTLPLGILSAIGEVEVRHVTASPLWINGDDWKDSLDFISGAAQAARVLVIHDFEVAMQDTYLIPPLRSWLSSIRAESRNRVILTPAVASMDEVSPRVLECSILMPHDTSFFLELERLLVGLQAKHEDSWRTNSPAAALAFVESFNREYEQQLRQLASNCGAELPIEVAARFVSVSDGLGQLMGQQESARIASEVSLLPWLRSSRGEGAARIVEETLRTAFGGS
jgi:DNA-binding transcriptional MerR regulator